MIIDHNGRLITDPIERANSLKFYYASLFSCERNNPQIQSAESGKLFIISTNIIRKRLTAIGRKKSVGPDGIPTKILKLGRGSNDSISPETAGYYDEQKCYPS